MEHQDWKPTVINQSGSNTHHKRGPPPNKKFQKLDGDDPDKPKTVSRTLSLQIQQARMSKKMSQKDLARQTNLRLDVIKDYENGRMVPNGSELARLSRELSVKLKK